MLSGFAFSIQKCKAEVTTKSQINSNLTPNKLNPKQQASNDFVN
jgi:hypothetical protein